MFVTIQCVVHYTDVNRTYSVLKSQVLSVLKVKCSVLKSQLISAMRGAMGMNGPTFVPKSGYFSIIWVKVCPQKLAFS